MRPSVLTGHSADQVLRRGPEALGPVLAHEVEVAADAAGGDDHRLGLGAEKSSISTRELSSPRPTSLGSSTTPETPVTVPSVEVELVDAVAEGELDDARSTSGLDPSSRTVRARPGPVPQVM